MKFYKKYFFLLPVVSLLFSGCESFEQLNENPNEPTIVSPDVLLTSSLRSSMVTMVEESFLLGNNIGQLTAKTLRTEVDAYNWNAFPTLWEGLYGSLTDLFAVEKQAIASGNQQMQGVAMVLKAWIFASLTNAYGDIPYSEAIRGDEDNFTPAYDRQELIYQDILAQLELAAGLLNGSGNISGDILLNGDALKWQKLANSLRLRYLMYASAKLDNAKNEFASIVAAEPLMTSNEDNATLTFLDGFPNQFPLVPLKTGDFDAVALSENAFNALNTSKDPRLARFARPDNDDYSANALFSGAQNGAGGVDCNKAGSRLGAAYYNDPAQTTANDLGISLAKGILMTYAELEFLLAEAAAMGWITTDIETHYRQGMEASMTYHEVAYEPFGWTDFDDFYQNAGVAYSQVTDIWKQKWLALYFHGLEPFFEVRRWYVQNNAGWDALPFLSAPCQNANNDQLPMRFLYPGQEQSLNALNYADAVNRLGGFNSQNAKMWLVE